MHWKFIYIGHVEGGDEHVLFYPALANSTYSVGDFDNVGTAPSCNATAAAIIVLLLRLFNVSMTSIVATMLPVSRIAY